MYYTTTAAISDNRFNIFYEKNLDGGGFRFGKAYLDYFKENELHAKRLLEWCSGPGFIGFELLSHGYCDHLTLVDINPKAVSICRKTIEENGLNNKVDVIQAGAISEIPQDTSPWDIVVSNPPHWVSSDCQGRPDCLELLYLDKDWQIHSDFYNNIHRFLEANSTLIIQENKKASTTDDFKVMIADGGLQLVGDAACSDPGYYYIVSRLK